MSYSWSGYRRRHKCPVAKAPELERKMDEQIERNRKVLAANAALISKLLKETS